MVGGGYASSRVPALPKKLKSLKTFSPFLYLVLEQVHKQLEVAKKRLYN